MRFVIILILLFPALLLPLVQAQVQHLVRYSHQQQVSYGQLLGDEVQPLAGDLFDTLTAVGKPIALNKVKLLLPVDPQKVFAVGMNFASHMSSPSDAPPPLFLKLPSSLINSGEIVQLPADATNVHFEGELVIVIGKHAKNLSQDQALDAIFGVAVGNDITERNWQSTDLQWMRAKASDGFGPLGPVIATGVDFNNLLLTTRLNGEIVQQENTRFMIHKPAKVVSYLSQYFSLSPGDLIFMGTPGRTRALMDKDEVSVTLEKVGSVTNTIKH